jgi:hypothetical protein
LELGDEIGVDIFERTKEREKEVDEMVLMR